MFWQHILIVRQVNPSNRTFQKSEHVEIIRREGRTVSRMFQEFKFQILDVSFIFLSVCYRVLSCCKITVCDNRPLRFMPIAAFSSSVKKAQWHSLFTVSPFAWQCSNLGPCYSRNSVSITFASDDWALNSSLEKKRASCVSFAVYCQALNSGPMPHLLLLYVLKMPHFSFHTAPVTWCTLTLDFCCVSVVKYLGNRLAQTFVNCKSLLITLSTEPLLIPSLSTVVSAVIRLSARISS